MILVVGASFLLEGPVSWIGHDLAEGLGDFVYDADGHRGHHPLDRLGFLKVAASRWRGLPRLVYDADGHCGHHPQIDSGF
ncbi:hypothetical protein [Micromonospora parva]|uniref:hypothetical protein n=1 Tax=Micromonospora parva TaxID=1464048 RepID=UPI0034041D15